MSTTVITNRKNRRKAEQSKARNKQAAKLGAIGLATMLLAGASSGGAIAAESTTGAKDVVVSDWGYGDGWSIDGKTSFTNAEYDKILKSAAGIMQGSVKLTMSASDQQKLKDAGVTLDLANSQKMTNSMTGSDGTLVDNAGERNRLHLDVKLDKTKMKSVGKTMGLKFDESYEMDDEFSEDDAYKFGSIASHQKIMSDNIMTDEVWGAPRDLAKGSRVTYSAVQPYWDKNDTTGGILGASLYPVSALSTDGVLEGKATTSERTLTTITDPYSDGDSKLRSDAILAANERALPTLVSNCIDDDCGVWLTVGATDDTGHYLVTDPVRLNVETTLSAGKTPTEFKVASGETVKYVPKKQDTVYDNWHSAPKLAPWEFAADFNAYVESLADLKVGKTTVNVEGVELEVADRWFGGSANISVSPTYSLNVLPADKPAPVVPKPDAFPDVKSGVADKPVVIDVLTNDKVSKGFTIQKNTLRLIDPISKKATMSVAVDKQGTYVVNVNGTVTFTPVKSFSGKAMALGYSWNETDGTLVQAASSTVQAVITPVVKPEEKPEAPKPTAKPDVKTGKFEKPLVIDVLTNDVASKGFTIQKPTLRLIDPVSKKAVPSVKVKAGTYVANSNGTVTFTPVKGFSGTATALGYSWQESNGTIVQTASSTVQAIITPIVDKPVEKPKDPVEKPKDPVEKPKDPVEKPEEKPKPKTPKPAAAVDAKTGKFGEVVTVDVLTNDAAIKGESIEKDSLALIDPDSKKEVATYTFKGQGTYSVKEAKVVFNPESDFDGVADKLSYNWAQSDGQVADSTVQVTILPTDENDGGGDEKKDDESAGGGDEPTEEILDAGAAIAPLHLAGGLAGIFMLIMGALMVGGSSLKNRFNRSKN